MMRELFRRIAGSPAFEADGLGTRVIACPVPAACQLPAGAIGVVVGPGGHTRRVSGGGRMVFAAGDAGWCFHPGPYGCDLQPFAAAPEIGLRVAFAVDSPDPRMTQQRFDLYLASEASGELTLAAFAAQAQEALQRELAQGNLELPPCTTLDEWNAFRGGFNQLMYTRFGVSVDDCVPVDLAGSRDYARALRERAGPAAAPGDALAAAPAPPAGEGHAAPAPFDPAVQDARALRRLFLELPCLMCRVRLAALPQEPGLFRQQQHLLARLDLLSLAAGTMPALALAAPGQPLAPGQQGRRARHSLRAQAALDDAWALLARLEHLEHQQRADELRSAPGTPLAALFDEADRIVANLEHDMDGRRQPAAPGAAS